jgi:hypothetical protein
MTKEIRKETDWLGREKEVVYDSGEKVGEVKHEKTFWGTPVERTYDTKGERVVETRYEKTFLGTPIEVTRDTKGNVLSKTRHEKTIFGTRKDVIYEDKEKIGELRKEKDWLGRKKEVLREYEGHNIDLARRVSRENQDSNESNNSYSGSIDDYVSESIERKTEVKEEGGGFWSSFYETVATIAERFGKSNLAKRFWLKAGWACGNDFKLAALYAEKGGDLETAVWYYGVGGFDDEAIELCLKYGMKKSAIRFLSRHSRYSEAAKIAESMGLVGEAVELYVMGASCEKSKYVSLNGYIKAEKLAESHELLEDAIDICKRISYFTRTDGIYEYLNKDLDILDWKRAKEYDQISKRLEDKIKGIEKQPRESSSCKLQELLHSGDPFSLVLKEELPKNI